MWKKQPQDDHREGECLKELMRDKVKDVVPKFHREIECNNMSRSLMNGWDMTHKADNMIYDAVSPSK